MKAKDVGYWFMFNTIITLVTLVFVGFKQENFSEAIWRFATVLPVSNIIYIIIRPMKDLF